MEFINKKELLKKFSKNLKNIRLKNNKTQEEIADALNIHVVTYSHYKNNQTYNICLYNLYKISKVLNININDLLK